MITETFEPLRPIYCKSDHDAEYHSVLGTGMVFYGASYWPSRSYTVWVWHEFGERVVVNIRTVEGKREVLKLSI